MSNRKVDNYVSKEINGILKESREFRAFQLGWAQGWFNLYEHIKREVGEAEADRIFDVSNTEDKNETFRSYFLKMIELSKQPEDEGLLADKILDMIHEYKNKGEI